MLLSPRVNIDEGQALPVAGLLIADIDTDVVIRRYLLFEVMAYFIIGTAAEHIFLLLNRLQDNRSLIDSAQIRDGQVLTFSDSNWSKIAISA